jgi:threonine dehydratase
MRALGAEVEEYGRDFDEAREFVESLSAHEGWRYVHNANEPHLISGVATYAVELFEECPDADYVFVPIGGGSGAAGCALVRTALGSHAKVIGVQAARADAFARSWRGPVRVDGRADTFAEGIATRTTFDLTFSLLKAGLDDVVTLEESELEEGLSAALRCTHNLAEGAGAAALAAARKAKIPADARVVCVMSGGNADERTVCAVRLRDDSQSVSMDQSNGIDPEEDIHASSSYLYPCCDRTCHRSSRGSEGHHSRRTR